jgi:glycine cleavage system H protein
MYPQDYHYTKEHEWVKTEGSQALVGITIYAQKELGDIVYVDLPAVGKKYNPGEPFGTVESVKAVSEIYAPVSMEIVETNQTVIDQPELINQDAHEKGWLVKVKILNQSDVEGLLTADEYQELISKDQH